MRRQVSSRGLALKKLGIPAYVLGAGWTVIQIYWFISHKTFHIMLLFVFGFLICLFGYGGFELFVKEFGNPWNGEMEIDNEKITFYTLKHTKIVFQYDECEDIGFYIIPFDLARGDQLRGRIYLSKKKLSNERINDLYLYEINVKEAESKGLPKYKTEFIMFEYNPDSFRDLRDHLSNDWRDKLVEEEERIMKQFTGHLAERRDFWSRDGRTEIKQKSMKRDESKHSDGDFSEKK